MYHLLINDLSVTCDTNAARLIALAALLRGRGKVRVEWRQ